jgi:tRNA(His) 5'-end guanylyltransferase
MKFDELDARLRLFETAHDRWVLPGIHMVARLDGRGFTRLTKEIHRLKSPYDLQFRDYMVATVEYLMTGCGLQIIYGFTQSDEISLLFHPEESAFGRKIRKYNSVLAGECSAKFSLLLGDLACFDCRISEFPRIEDVIDYFRWRSEDAHRNVLNAHCYWTLRGRGYSAQSADQELKGMSVDGKDAFLFQQGINFNDLPNWQKRGIGVYWEAFEKEGWNPRDQAPVYAKRRRLKVDCDLPMREEYNEFIKGLLENRSGGPPSTQTNLGVANSGQQDSRSLSYAPFTSFDQGADTG